MVGGPGTKSRGKMAEPATSEASARPARDEPPAPVSRLDHNRNNDSELCLPLFEFDLNLYTQTFYVKISNLIHVLNVPIKSWNELMV